MKKQGLNSLRHLFSNIGETSEPAEILGFSGSVHKLHRKKVKTNKRENTLRLLITTG